ncbi:MAG: beta-glucuronidase [Ruminococcus sp.]|nr:beta-glucuronidase [Ruminococcus sp.]
MTDKITLTDSLWKFRLYSKEECPKAPDINAAFDDTVMLPSTVSSAEKAPLTEERSDGFLTDPRRFEGYAVYERTAEVTKDDNCDIFLCIERTRTTALYIDGKFAGTRNSLCASHRYNITELAGVKPLRITLLVDNISCPVPGGHMTSQDTQTNWLGVTGDIYIEYREKCRPEEVRIFPDPDNMSVTVKGVVNSIESCDVTLSVEGFPDVTETVRGKFEIIYKMENAVKWSEHSPKVYTMKIKSGRDIARIDFGLRKFTVSGNDILLNGEKIFLRGKHDGMIFPLTAAAPTDKAAWLKVMEAAKEHGINHYRFHTCCPPEAAFEAADELGIYLEPELPFWGTVDETLTPGQQYLVDEGYRILDEFGNHPSFFALSLGNELWGSTERLNEILGDYKAHDSRPLYTQGSNNFQFWPQVLPNDDFFVGVRCSRDRLFRGSYAMCDAPQGHIQTCAPNSSYNYDSLIRPPMTAGSGEGTVRTIEIQYGTGVKTVTVDSSSGELIPKVPVVSHEVGQYFMYPDYKEIEKYTGVLKPYNLEIFRERLQKAGLLRLADKYFQASGRFAAECYKAEIETALRSRELAGFQLLDIQDFTGQGTALVGVLNAFMENKGVISPEEWRNFCSDRVILGCLPRFTYTAGEKVFMEIMLYSYTGKEEVSPKVTVTFGDAVQTVKSEGVYKNGTFTVGTAELEMPALTAPCRRDVILECGEAVNNYTLWIYPECECECNISADIVTDWGEAKERLAEGERLLFIPKGLPDEKSVEGTYCTDFWNYPMFKSISVSMNKPLPAGTLGLLTDSRHRALREFPSLEYSTPQWYDIVTNSRAAVLDGIDIDPIVRVIDNCERNHSLGLIFEANVNGGKLLCCTSNLLNDTAKDSVPCKQLLKSLSDYVKSDEFEPVSTVEIGELDRVFEE